MAKARTLVGLDVHAMKIVAVVLVGDTGELEVFVLNGENVGPVTLFRAYPDGVDTFAVKASERSDAGYRRQLLAHNEYNRRIFERVHAGALAGDGVAISLTNCYRHTDFGDPIVALKSYVLSPFSDENRMQSIVNHVVAARNAIDQDTAG